MELIISTYYTLNTHKSINSMLHGIFIKFIPKYSFGILFFGPPCTSEGDILTIHLYTHMDNDFMYPGKYL